MENLLIDNHEFFKFSEGKANIIFSTAKGNLNFNIHQETGKKNIEKLKEWFKLDDVGFLHQIHSDLVYDYDGSVKDGDGLITNKINTAIGVFTADCVPVLIYDRTKEVISAVHSGWKGTLAGIVIKCIEKMEKEYGSTPENLSVYIGPHNKGCCYEIGEDVEKMFKSNKLYDNVEIIKNNKLNLEKCIITQLESKGIRAKNITTMNVCTFCNKNFELYSYRKSREDYGRMFSFIYMN